MRRITREEVATEFRIPLASVVSRMAELGVNPYLPQKRGRGHCHLYDANEIITALQDERERLIAKREKRPPRIRRASKSVFSLSRLPWKEAEKILTAQGAMQ